MRQWIDRTLEMLDQGAAVHTKMAMVRSWQVALAIFIGSIGLASAQDVAAGKKSFVKCSPCHAIGPGAQNKIGPIQNGLDGRKSGTIPGYNYSDANKNSGIVCGTRRQSRNTSPSPGQRFREPKWFSLASRTRKKPPTCGHTSNSSTRTAISNNSLGSRPKQLH